VVSLAASALADDKPDAKADQKKLEGAWSVSKEVKSDVSTPEEDLKDQEVIFKGDRVTLKRGDKKVDLTVTLDPNQKPPSIDLSDLKHPISKLIGIYQLDGDTLKILCIQVDDRMPGVRPKSFDDNKKEYSIHLELKRKKK
jgi:uncharacterized protein (TIGR03067 family)